MVMLKLQIILQIVNQKPGSIFFIQMIFLCWNTTKACLNNLRGEKLNSRIGLACFNAMR